MKTDSNQFDRAASPGWREQREARGLSLRATARQASLDPAHLSRVERGQAQLSLKSALRLAEILGLEQAAEVLQTLLGARE
jgi:transcriptional regulator with XRE-family HTH domain